ncbi:hypothetical protein EJ06DRAFT_545311 [Trichodelitschia bisporula]|uniref:dipeptidyl-peptidase IV n=1 Tax=Trichodelitschia bisporula TaxID=703511 RepID=A0A6G1HIY2_9PEZI|nr:hypothetical protein EJ06DRAFT_545311 [Trichodelitschia bisporula]
MRLGALFSLSAPLVGALLDDAVPARREPRLGSRPTVVPPLRRAPRAPTGNGTKLLTFAQSLARELSPSLQAYTWAPAPLADGIYTSLTAAGLLKTDILSDTSEVLIPASRIPKGVREATLSPDGTRVLWAVNATKQYRYSFFGDYLVQSVAAGPAVPLVPESKGDTALAVWAPGSDPLIAFVRHNDVHLWTPNATIPITSTGGADLFHGVPDWVYEEEILEGRVALWFSPDASHLAFLSFNETGVPSFRVPYYMNKQAPAAASVPLSYPRELEIRYPKVGATNPRVSTSVVNTRGAPVVRRVELPGFPRAETIVGEVLWPTRRHDKLLIRTFDRVQERAKHVLYDVAAGSVAVVRERDGRDAWLDNLRAAQYVGPVAGSGDWYLDLDDVDGWSHLYLFPVAGGVARQLTKGEWEVRKILHVDARRGIAYFTSTQHHPIDSHVFSVDLASGVITPLTPANEPGSWSASFTPNGDLYVLSYLGPNIPHQQLYSAYNTASPLSTLTSNAALSTTISQYALPRIEYFDLPHPSGFNLSARLQYPVNRVPGKKYPLLLTPYGGPGAQEVDSNFGGYGWAAYIASDPLLEWASLTVDGRGTGWRGRAFRGSVTGRLGSLEAEDQIWAAKAIAARENWVDAEKIGIWGWSFGGYLSAKVVELDSGAISLGMITAPVTDWRLYDSMYTERYMKTLAGNGANYSTTAVRKAAGFKNIKGGVLLQHGTGDDNVHFQNAAALVDLLIGQGVSPDKLRVQFFTDSDHSIAFHGGNRFLYRQLTSRLYEEKLRDPKAVPVQTQWRAKSTFDRRKLSDEGESPEITLSSWADGGARF